MRALIALAISVVVLVGSTQRAHADESDGYTKKVVIADVLSVGTLIAGSTIFLKSWGGWDCGNHDDDDCGNANVQYVALGMVAVGLAGYVIAPPIIHLREDGGGAALRSLGLRLAIPLLLGLATADSAYVGVVGGVIIAPIVDWIWTSSTTPDDPATARNTYVTPLAGGFAVGYAGAF